jgi:hypothetical protein
MGPSGFRAKARFVVALAARRSEGLVRSIQSCETPFATVRRRHLDVPITGPELQRLHGARMMHGFSACLFSENILERIADFDNPKSQSKAPRWSARGRASNTAGVRDERDARVRQSVIECGGCPKLAPRESVRYAPPARRFEARRLSWDSVANAAVLSG